MGEELLENYTLYYETADGEKGKLSEIVNLEDLTSGVYAPDCDNKFMLPNIDYNNFCASIDLMLRLTHVRGMLDCLLGDSYTAAAGRWKRLCKRHKEKARRKKLKGTAHANWID